MRAPATVAVVLLLVLAGCSAGFQGGFDAEPPTATPVGAETSTPDPTPTAAGDTALPDPPTDRLGWEAGYWYNESLSVTPENGLNESELEAVVARSMARVERVRELEFERQVPVEIISRAEYRDRSSGTEYTETFTTFDNAKFETLFLIGEERDSLAVQNTNRGSNVLGFYSSSNDSIVVVAESETPVLEGELTLGHELVHALQDQRYNLSSYVRPTRDVYNAYNGIIEGDANLVQQRYERRCGTEWECLSVQSESGSGSGGDLHLGVYFLNFFPYSDGPGFVRYHEQRGGWEAVDRIYEAPPASSEQVIYPDRYPDATPTEVELTDTNGGEWERVSPGPQRPGGTRPAYATFGQSGIVSMFAYTAYDEYNGSRVVSPRSFLNADENGNVNSTDPLNYDVDYAAGWAGDRLHVYDTPGADNETAYVWRVAWDSPAEAAEFVTGYRALLSHWGGERVDGSPNHWVVESGPFADVFYLEVTGDTVTIVNAPTREDLGAVYADYERPPASTDGNGGSDDGTY
jgi:hypothetical protein